MPIQGLVQGLLLVLVASLAGCSESPKTEATVAQSAKATNSDPSASPSESATPTPPPAYVKVPAGIELTEPGLESSLGDWATVAWELPADPVKKTKKGKKAKKAKVKVAVVKLRVKRVEAATLKEFAGWDLNKAARKSNPFFVQMTVKNVGKTDLSGVKIPLYIVDGTDTLIRPSTFVGDFTACPSTPFPDGFKPGKSIKVCNVYLSPKNGGLAAVSFRPTEKFDPIIWTGKAVPYESKKGKKKSTP